MSRNQSDKPIRVGVFRDVNQAEQAVNHLRLAGFRQEEIAVICADSCIENQQKVGTKIEKGASHPGESVARGGLIGATIGGLVLGATALTTGGASLLVAGAASIAGGALVGSFTGLMVSRGLKPDLVDYYDQAVRLGRILVAVEVDGEKAENRLAVAEQIFTDTGTEPVALTEAHGFKN